MDHENVCTEMFGLTYEQVLLMFSTQRLLILQDINITKDAEKKRIKTLWLHEWENNISIYLDNIDGSKKGQLIEIDYIQDSFEKALTNNENLTWYYIMVLELIAFVPYTPLNSKNDKDFSKCKYESNQAFNRIKKMVIDQKHMSGVEVERLRETYNKQLHKLSGKTSRILQSALITLSVTAALAALAAIFAGPIAVAIFGAAFPGLHGVALTSACLAMLGGGAVAIGGTGIAGGVAVVAGGGALLGMAGGGAIAGSTLLFQSPDFTLTQAAKLETVLCYYFLRRNNVMLGI